MPEPTATALDSPSPWLTLKQAASYGKCSDSTIRRAVKRGRLIAYRVGGGSSIRIHLNDFDSWLRQSPTRADG